MNKSQPSINYKDVKFYTKLIQDYFSGVLTKENVIDWDYNSSALNRKINERSFDQRELLHAALANQNNKIALSSESQKNIELLKENNSYTVCTGHQLCIYGGPAYFYSKIIDVIELCKQLKQERPQDNFVPVFWMASEDHDFEEINTVTLFNKKLTWEENTSGAVGEIDTKSMSDVHNQWNEILGDNEKVQTWKTIFNEVYISSEKDLAEATRHLVNEVFGGEGIVVLDGNDASLKALFLPVVEKEITDLVVKNEVSKQIEAMHGYKIQATPRDINLFYLDKNYRVRIEKTGDVIQTVDEKFVWTIEEFLSHVRTNPEKVSPNVFLRPVFQELCLPNVAYVGGAGEIAYWLELPLLFEKLKVQFPIPVVRNSYLYMDNKELASIQTLNLTEADFFEDSDRILNKVLASKQTETIDLEREKEKLNSFFNEILEKAIKIDPNLEKVVLGENKRSLSSLENMEKRFKNAEKSKLEAEKSKIAKIKKIIFPEGTYQERRTSMVEISLKANVPLDDFWNKISQANVTFDNSIKIISY